LDPTNDVLELFPEPLNMKEICIIVQPPDVEDEGAADFA
jgi:hypothetical protein